MSWSTFGIASDEIGERLSYAITMALTIVAFQFIISERLPKVNYMTLLDKYNFYIFSLVLFMTVETTIVGYNGQGLIENAADIDDMCAYIFLAVFIGGNLLFLIYASCVNCREMAKTRRWPEYRQDVYRRYNDEEIRRAKPSHTEKPRLLTTESEISDD